MMSNKSGLTIKQTARFAILLLVVACVIWAVYLMAIGLPVMSYQAIAPGESPLPGHIVYQPYYGAIYSLLALALVTLGLLNDKWLGWAWAGVALHFIAGGLLIFSQGILYILLAGVLAVPMGILHTQVGNSKLGFIGAWSGVGLALITSFVLTDPLRTYSLVSGIGLALFVASLNWHSSHRSPA